LNQNTVNNYAAGTTFGKITIAEGNSVGYTLAGSRINLTGGIAASGTLLSFTPVVTCDLTLGARQVFSSTRSLIVSNVDLNGKILDVSGAGSLTLAGTVTDTGGNFGVINKTNSGTLFIPGSARFQVSADRSPAYSSLYLESGTLRLDGVATNATGSVEINLYPYHGPITLTGTGIVDRVVVGYGDVISPGNGGPGILQCNSMVPFEGVSSAWTFLLEINGPTPGTQHDQLVTDNPWVSSFDIRLSYVPQLGDSFLVIRKRVPDSAVGAYGWFEITNGCTLVDYTTSNGVFLTTVRRPDSPFALWKGPTNFFSPDARWSQTNNWAGGVTPVSHGHVRFSEYGFSFYGATNDLPAGSTLASILFSRDGYSLYGNALTITEGITNRVGSGTNAILLDLVTAGPLALDVDPGGTLVFTRSFNGSGTVRKEGGGTLRCTGTTLNSFVGSFVVNGGTFRVDGSLTDGSFMVNGGVLNGTGTVSSVTMNGGTLNPGDSPGVFHIQGDLTMSAGAVFQVELNGPIAGSTYDQLQVDGAVNLGEATLEVQPGYSITPGTAFLILINDGSDPIVGTFAGLPQGAIFQAGGQYFSISYHSGAGNNDVVLTRVNPPPPPSRFSNITRPNPNTVQLQGLGGSNVNYIIQANTNLATTNWVDLGAAPSDAFGQFLFTDTNGIQFPSRFFRTKNP